MEQKEKEAALEAILFAMGDSVELDRLAAAIGEDAEETRRILTEMKERWEKEERGVCLVEYEGAFQMCTRGDLYEYLIRVAKTPKKYALTDTLLETLSIIAYKQPVTRLDVERIRGVNSDHAINRLVEFDLVTELGRLDAPGRPLLFGTTEQFLRSFGVKSLEDLPRLNEAKLEEFRAEAEVEVQEMNAEVPEEERH
ncbi:MAG TPA: SMC-Scp complex subunit ScpB [Candidatus Eisenbergiella merdipullorum]|uniref:Segregation and condensation protein B n=1 Tax=Candidatus Eisenbergiella merdipullorum TaxID=2838553 RepID=A0A9D2I598_9FIRM|nr:SMC-Scp complex subunit ScpB [Candidatus Eisenbergiella merdipullorum]